MKRLLLLALALLWSLPCPALSSGEKTKFDLDAPSTPPALNKTADIWGGRLLLTRPALEASMIEGGYFTLGTKAGLSPGTLDDACTLTFGHPYAKTSYPLVYLDGTWLKAEGMTSSSALPFPERAGDSLMLTLALEGRMRLRFVIRFETADGSQLRISSMLTNIDSAPHTLGAGLVIDPALGKGGDAALSIGASRIVRDTMLSSPQLFSSPIMMSERSSALSGLRASVSFPSELPSTVIVANWNDAWQINAPTFTASDVRTLYDALVKIFWTPVSVPAQGTITRDVRVTLLDPVFGQGAFCRWDLPQTQSVENGIPFPKSFTSTVTVANMSGQTKNLIEVSLALPAEVQASPALRTLSLSTSASSSCAFALSTKELFENKVVTLRALVKEGQTVLDSIAMPFRICNAPLSDTGLVVTIDSVIASRAPSMSVIFSVQKKSPLQYVFGLERDNVFLYENQARITDFTLGKDTTGGAGSVDIVFVFDVTGSMSGSITGVKNNIMEFADTLARRGIDYRLGMVTFLDAVENVYDFTNDPGVFKTRVSQQYAHGGDDMPENSLDALYRATEMTFRPTAAKVFIWITDATYHEKDVFTRRTRQEVIDRLLATGVKVHAIGTQSYQTDWYNPITNATGGNYYNIYGNFRDILLDIGNLRGSSRYLATYRSAVQGARQLTLTIHYAGYGGTASLFSARTDAASRSTVPGSTLACYPNPFNPQTTIEFSIPKDAHAEASIYNIAGEEIEHFSVKGNGTRTQYVWNAQNGTAAAGVYFIRARIFSSSNALLRVDVAKLLYLK
ncbi:MAG: VWA domain-containing protein [Acidobacteriota bacterium]